jgi:hypothetical protein
MIDAGSADLSEATTNRVFARSVSCWSTSGDLIQDVNMNGATGQWCVIISKSDEIWQRN